LASKVAQPQKDSYKTAADFVSVASFNDQGVIIVIVSPLVFSRSYCYTYRSMLG